MSEADIKAIYNELKSLNNVIRGHNGAPGIITRLSIIELFMEEMKDRKHNQWDWARALIAPIITGVFVAIIVASLLP